jgi:hypothetical protein
MAARIDQLVMTMQNLRAEVARLEASRAEFARSADEWRTRAETYRVSLQAITKLPVGVIEQWSEIDATSWVEPCPRCGEAHDIAAAALQVRS